MRTPRLLPALVLVALARPAAADGPRSALDDAEVRERYDRLPADEKARLEAVTRSVAVIRGVSTSLGTGFVVAPGVVATNAHVIGSDPVGGLTVQFASAAEPDAPRLPVRILYQDTALDLALLAVATDRPPLAVLPAADLRPGRRVAAIGNPAEFKAAAVINAVSVGAYRETVTGFGDVVETYLRGVYYKTDALVVKGNSGGPVVCLDSGAVVGVVAFKDLKDGSKAVCVPGREVTAALAVVGPKAGWAARADVQAARHAAILARAAVADSARLAEKSVGVWKIMLESRSTTVERTTGDSTPAGGRPVTERINGVDYVKEIGRAMRADHDRARPAFVAAKAGNRLPEKLRDGMNDLSAKADEMATIVKDLTPARYRDSAARVKRVAGEFAERAAAVDAGLAALNGK